MNTAIVTGATGCIGRNLVDVLLEQNWKVTVFHRAETDLSRLDGCDVETRCVDYYNYCSVADNMERVDAVFNAAGNTSYWKKDKTEQLRANYLLPYILACVARERKVGRFIHTSTAATFAKKIGPKINHYVWSKKLAENKLQSIDGLDTVFLNPVVVIGKYDYNGYGKVFADIANRKIKVSFPGEFSFCHARSVAEAHVGAFHRGKTNCRYSLGGPWATWEHVFSLAAAMTNTPKIRVIPKWILHLYSRWCVAKSCITKTKPMITPELVRLLTNAKKEVVSLPSDAKYGHELGYESKSIRSMVGDCIYWMKLNDLL